MGTLGYSDYSRQEAWGGQTPPPRRNRFLLAGIFLLMGCLTLCLCWVLASFFLLRQPNILTAVWVTNIDLGYYTYAQDLTCPASQARQVTQQMRDLKITFPNFTSSDVTMDGDSATVNTQARMGGELQPWVATFTIAEGGQLGRCIQNIVLTEAE